MDPREEILGGRKSPVVCLGVEFDTRWFDLWAIGTGSLGIVVVVRMMRGGEALGSQLDDAVPVLVGPNISRCSQ
jgi:hypothetical protein